MPLGPGCARSWFRWSAAALTALRVGVSAYAIVLILAFAFESQLVYMPAKYPAGNWQPAGLNVEDVFFTSADGTRLHGWYLPRDDAIASVLFLHGTGGNVTDWYETIWHLHHTTRVNVFAFDYRGFGKSEGAPHEAGVLQDARAARRWLAERVGAGEGEIVLMGRSLGGGIAVRLAAESGAQALVLERTFTSLPEAAGARYPFFPTTWMMKNRFNSAQAIRRYHGPLLQSHGTRDEVIPFDQGRTLFELADCPVKEFIAIPGGRHNSPQPKRYYDKLRQFLLDTNAS